MGEIKRIQVRRTALDRAIGWVSPATEAARLQARVQVAALGAVYGGRGGYVGARRDRGQTKNWNTPDLSADAAALPDLHVLRSRSHDLFRNSPLGGGALRTVRTAVVGAGLQPQPQVDRELLRLDEAQADAWERTALREFRHWSATRQCDIRRQLTFGEQTGLALLSVLSGGDCFAVRRFRARAGCAYGLTWQLVEGDRVDTPTGRFADPSVVAGVESDADGMPVAYHIADRSPGALRPGPQSWTRFPAWDEESGERLILHLVDPERLGQTRGVPYLAPVIEALKQITDYSEAELHAAVLTACFAIITKLNEGDDALPVAGSDEKSPLGRFDVNLESGQIIEGFRPGETIEGFTTSRPNQAFEGFTMAMARMVGVALEIPYEVLIRHFTASYSASRAALLEAWRMFRRRRAWLVGVWCQPAWEAFVAEAVARGRLIAPGYFEDELVRAAWNGCTWAGPTMPSIDLVKEATGNGMMVDRGWKTDQEVTAETTGGDWEANVRQRAKEIRLAREAGLGGAAAASPPTGDAPADREDQGDGPDLEEEDEG